jgi:hypothetical protein
MIFVSCATAGREIAEPIPSAIERGLTWKAPRDIRPGALQAEEIIAAVDRSDALVVVLSPSSDASPRAAASQLKPDAEFRRHLSGGVLTLALEPSRISWRPGTWRV